MKLCWTGNPIYKYIFFFENINFLDCRCLPWKNGVKYFEVKVEQWEHSPLICKLFVRSTRCESNTLLYVLRKFAPSLCSWASLIAHFHVGSHRLFLGFGAWFDVFIIVSGNRLSYITNYVLTFFWSMLKIKSWTFLMTHFCFDFPESFFLQELNFFWTHRFIDLILWCNNDDSICQYLLMNSWLGLSGN